jgi:hypothetical protein
MLRRSDLVASQPDHGITERPRIIS